MVFDLTKSPKSYTVEYWIKSIISLNRTPCVILVGTHADKVSLKSEQTKQKLKKIANMAKSVAGVHVIHTISNVKVSLVKI